MGKKSTKESKFAFSSITLIVKAPNGTAVRKPLKTNDLTLVEGVEKRRSGEKLFFVGVDDLKWKLSFDEMDE
tara:strand:+ start:373 stop:588 length:216 start_codon:yes stop_codon:yes gene_type:complete